MLVLGLTLLLFSVILYNKYSQKLYEDMDDALESRAERIADSIDTYWEAERLEALKDGSVIDSLSKIDNINFAKIAQRWVEERSSDPKLLSIIVQIFNVKGTKSEITVIDEKNQKLIFLVKGTTTIYDTYSNTMVLGSIKKDLNVKVAYVTTKEGVNEATSIRLQK